MKLPTTPAGRLEYLMSLRYGPLCETEDGELVRDESLGGLISDEDFKRMLDMPGTTSATPPEKV